VSERVVIVCSHWSFSLLEMSGVAADALEDSQLSVGEFLRRSR
jgi:hypothetical protein